MENLKKVKRRIAALEDASQERTSERVKGPGNRWNELFALGWRVALEWTVAVLVGYGVGYFIDTLCGTDPWGLIVFLLLGNVAGLLNIYRIVYKAE